MAEKIKVPAGVYDMVTRCMEREFPENTAIRYVAADGKTVVEKKYKEYAQDIRKMVSYLKNEVPDIKGKRIALLSRNNYEFCVASFGIILAGGVLVTLNQKKTWDELEYELGLVEPALILNDGVDYGYRPQLEAAYGPLLCPMDCYTASAPIAELTNCVGHDDLMMLMFTSGTTGRSKGVMLSERNMCTTLVTYLGAEEWMTDHTPEKWRGPLSHMTLLPLFHMACFVCVVAYPPVGWAMNLCGDIRDFYRDLGLMHSDIMASAPMLVETVYNDFKRGRIERINGLWNLCCSSAALDPQMLLELAQNGFVIDQCYGMTETFGDGILNFTQEEKHMGAVGKPDDHCEYKLDEETGEICIRGGCVMLGYYKDPEATAEVLDKDGWFHTGDLGRMDEDGFYYITGRKKNLIILSNGENVSPEELEHQLAKCTAVQECIVKEKGQKICAVVYCAEDAQDAVRAYITEYNRTLPLYKRISAVEFSKEPLPRNAVGKLLRK